MFKFRKKKSLTLSRKDYSDNYNKMYKNVVCKSSNDLTNF